MCKTKEETISRGIRLKQDLNEKIEHEAKIRESSFNAIAAQAIELGLPLYIEKFPLEKSEPVTA